jgi:cleavage and polyadenylation specificity factor subunit 1
LLAIPKPTGGVLVISADTLIYVNTSPNVGVALNSYANSATDFPLDHSCENLGLTLEGCHAVVLDATTVLLSLANGEAYMVKLLQSGSSVSGFRLQKVDGFDFTQPSCACMIKEGYFFLGSRLGDSQLISYGMIEADERENAPFRPVSCNMRAIIFDFIK